MARSASRSTSLTKSFGPLDVTVSRSSSRAPRLMMLPARRAAFTAIVSIGCMVGCRVCRCDDRGQARHKHGGSHCNRWRRRPSRERASRGTRCRTRSIASLPCGSCSSRRATRATSARRRARCTRWASRGSCWSTRGAFPIAEAVALASGATAVLDAARVVATLDEALAGCVLAIGFSARPREFAGRVLAAARSRGRGDRAARARRRRVGVRHRDVGALQRRARALHVDRDDPRESRLSRRSISPPRCRSPRYELRLAASGGRGVARAAIRARTFDEIEALYAHAHAHARRHALPRSANAAASDAAAAAAFRARGARKGGGQHPARHPGAHRPDRRRAAIRSAATTVARRCCGAIAIPDGPQADALAPRSEPVAQLRRKCARPLLPGVRPGNARALPTFAQFLREATGRYVAFDGKLWKTLFPLLFRPGFLTRAYLAGKRRRYIGPARLFLVSTRAVRGAALRRGVDGDPRARRGETGEAAESARMRARAKAECEGARRRTRRIDDDLNFSIGRPAGNGGRRRSRSGSIASTGCRARKSSSRSSPGRRATVLTRCSAASGFRGAA